MTLQCFVYLRIVFLAIELKRGKKTNIISKRLFGWCIQKTKNFVFFMACRIEASQWPVYKGREVLQILPPNVVSQVTPVPVLFTRTRKSWSVLWSSYSGSVEGSDRLGCDAVSLTWTPQPLNTTALTSVMNVRKQSKNKASHPTQKTSL